MSYATADGTATAPADYTSTSNSLTWVAGDGASKTVSVPVVGDTIDEVDETFVVNLGSASNAFILDGQGTGTIQDNDPPPSVSIGDVSKAEGNTGTTTFSFAVSLSAASGKTITVDYATADGTATAPSDYTGTSSTVTFSPGNTSKSVDVNVNGDTTVEPDETFSVNLSNPTNVTINDGQGQGTIQNDDSVAGADLSLTNTDSPDPVTADSTVTYTVTVTNGGPVATTNTTVTDTLPPNTIFVSAIPSQGAACTGSSVRSCNLGPINVSSSATVTVKVTPIQPSTITNQASVAADQSDPNTANNSASQDTTVKAKSGFKYVTDNDAGFSATTTTAALGNTVQYNFFGTITTHHLTDNSNLIDSGVKAPVSFFAFKFQAAGTYVVSDSAVPGSTNTVKIKPKIVNNGNGTYTLTWAQGTTPTGYGYDVQEKGPTDTAFRNIFTNTSLQSTVFTPDEGSGTYQFRARIRNPLTGKAAQFSPATSLVV